MVQWTQENEQKLLLAVFQLANIDKKDLLQQCQASIDSDMDMKALQNKIQRMKAKFGLVSPAKKPSSASLDTDGDNVGPQSPTKKPTKAGANKKGMAKPVKGKKGPNKRTATPDVHEDEDSQTSFGDEESPLAKKVKLEE